MSSTYQAYAVKDGDTLQSIAANMLDDANRWTEIADINGLSEYDISDEPKLGPTLGRLTLRINPVAGDRQLTLNEDVNYVTSNTVIYLKELMPNGTYKTDIVQVQSYDVTNNMVYLQSTLQNNYSGRVKCTVHPNPRMVNIRGLKKGDIILLPGTGEPPVYDNKQYLDKLFGQALQVNDKGELVAKNGSLALSHGLSNLHQALLNRAKSRRGAMPYHINYGSKTDEYIGAGITPGMLLLMKYDLTNVFKSDPRIHDVISMDVKAVGDTTNIVGVVETIAGHKLEMDDDIIWSTGEGA